VCTLYYVTTSYIIGHTLYILLVCIVQCYTFKMVYLCIQLCTVIVAMFLITELIMLDVISSTSSGSISVNTAAWCHSICYDTLLH
jgi:hypothetical protein